MASIAVNRVKREIGQIKKEDSFVSIEYVDNQITHLKGTIIGPAETPYAGGNFELDIQIPDSYPFQPPKIKFTTKIWHPNISSVTGAICLDILRDKWAAALTLRTVLISISAMMADPVPDDPQDAIVAAQYKKQNETWVKVAKFWTYRYANIAKNIEPDSELQQMESAVQNVQVFSNAPADKAITALSQKNWDADAAVEFITTMGD